MWIAWREEAKQDKMHLTDIHRCRVTKKLVVRYFRMGASQHIIIILIAVYISSEGEMTIQFANNAHEMSIGPAYSFIIYNPSVTIL